MKATFGGSDRCIRWSIGVLAAVTIVTALGRPAVAATPADFAKTEILRYVPISNSLSPVDPATLKTGCIYNRFDDGMNRRVWSVYGGDGGFWGVMGPGTVAVQRHFDVRESREQGVQRLEQVAPQLLRDLERIGSIEVNFRLGADDRWVFIGTGWAVTLFDLETGRRWERLSPGYVPVLHSSGDRWDYRNGKFVPAVFVEYCPF